MTNDSLAQAYLQKATKRLRILDVLLEEQAWSDVVREAQEVVELALKAMLRQVGIEPPHWHDVGPLLLEYRDRFPLEPPLDLDRLARISPWLRKEREMSFYGDIDVIPTEEYDETTAIRARDDARLVVMAASHVVGPMSGDRT